MTLSRSPHPTVPRFAACEIQKAEQMCFPLPEGLCGDEGFGVQGCEGQDSSGS